jgi:F-type H+-transporting ATPase subunit delta
MKNTRVARRYAAALMAAVETGTAAEETARDLQLVGSTLKASRDLRLLLASPIVPAGKKASIFKELFATRVKAPTMAFINLLIRKQREEVLEDAIVQFMALRDIQLNVVNITVVSAVELAGTQEEALRRQLERHTGKTVRLHLSINPAVKGGLVVRVGDTVLDASIRHQLELLGERFARGEYAAA